MSKNIPHDIEKARTILELPEEASIRQVKSAYRLLTLKYHPDRSPNEEREKSNEKMRSLNEAYKLLIEYCENYPVSFRETDVKRNDQEEDYKRFYDGFF